MADSFEPTGYELLTVSGNVWEWYSEWTYLSSPIVLSTPIPRGNLRERSPP